MVSPGEVPALGLETQSLPRELKFVAADGGEMKITLVVRDVPVTIGMVETAVDLLVATIPFQLILGKDWLGQVAATWDFRTDMLTLRCGDREVELPVLSWLEDVHSITAPAATEDAVKQNAKEAHERMMQALEELPLADAEALVRPAPRL